MNPPLTTQKLRNLKFILAGTVLLLILIAIDLVRRFLADIFHPAQPAELQRGLALAKTPEMKQVIESVLNAKPN